MTIPDDVKRDKTWIDDIKLAVELGYKGIYLIRLKNEPNPIARQRILHDARSMDSERRN